MQNPRWPSLLYCLKCCSRDPLGTTTWRRRRHKQKYRRSKKIENLSRVRESGRKAGGFSTSIKSKSRLATQQTGHVIAYTRPGAIGIRQNLSRVSYISNENMGSHLQYEKNNKLHIIFSRKMILRSSMMPLLCSLRSSFRGPAPGATVHPRLRPWSHVSSRFCS